MSYKYQMHAHTSPCSKCARMTIEELVESLHDGGYQGCVITNHFTHGYCGLDRSLPWEAFVREFEQDYLRGLVAAEKLDIDLLFGIEEGVGGGLEILCYGITPQMLYDHPELVDGNAETWYRVFHAYGAVVIQAHPFRDRDYIRDPHVLPNTVIDGIEVFNYSNVPADNERARLAAEEHPEWILVSGADTHWFDRNCVSGIETDTRIRNEKELAELLKSGKYRLITE